MKFLSQSQQKWLTFVMVWFAVFTTSYAQYQLPPIAPQLMQDLVMTQQQYSGLYNAPSWISVFLGVVIGLIADKFGVKRLVSITGVLCIAGLFGRVSATGYAMLFVTNLMTGFLACAVFTNRSKIFGTWFKPEELGMVMGITMTTTPAAATLAMSTTALFPSRQIAFIVSASLSVVFLVAWVLLFKEKPDEVEFPPPLPVLSYLKISAKNPFIWVTGFGLFFVMGAQVTSVAFLSSALQSRGLDRVMAGTYSSAVTIGNGIGAIIIPMICHKMGRFKPIIVVVTIIGSICLYFGWQMPIGPICFAIILIAGVAIGSMIPILSTFPVLLVGREYAGSAAGLTVTLQYLGAATIVTYIIVPIAQGSFSTMYMMGVVCMATAGILGMIVPELGSKGKRALEIKNTAQ
jgi:NNP family nitrate/nitrite transporter-like MFS transporter